MPYRAALVTGATSGIGEAFVRRLAPTTDLLLTGRNEAKLAAMRDEFGRNGRRVEIVVADLAKPDAAGRVADAAEAFGIDLLVNNAGLGCFGPFADHPLEDEAEMVTVNVLAPVVLTRRLLPGMRARAVASGGRAGIIMLASIVGFGPMPYFTTYAATKSFDLRFAQGLAAELRDVPVDVLALCPGTTDTGFFARAGFVKQGPEMTPDQVAVEGLAALGRRTVHVVGPVNFMIAMSLKLMPGGLITRAAARRLSKQ